MREWLTAALLAYTMCLCTSAASAGSVSPNSWRPYIDPTVLVTLGMSKGEVLIKAGKPATTELVSVGTDGHPSITVWTYIRTEHNEEVANLTPTGKPPPPAVRLAKALPFRRAQIERRDALTAHNNLHTADDAHAYARVGVVSDPMARAGRHYDIYAMAAGGL